MFESGVWGRASGAGSAPGNHAYASWLGAIRPDGREVYRLAELVDMSELGLASWGER